MNVEAKTARPEATIEYPQNPVKTLREGIEHLHKFHQNHPNAKFLAGDIAHEIMERIDPENPIEISLSIPMDGDPREPNREPLTVGPLTFKGIVFDKTFNRWEALFMIKNNQRYIYNSDEPIPLPLSVLIEAEWNAT